MIKRERSKTSLLVYLPVSDDNGSSVDTHVV